MIFGEFVKVNFSAKENEEEKMTRSFFNAIKQFFSSSEQPEEQPTPNNNNNKEDDAMNDKQFKQLIDAMNGLGTKIDSHFSAKVETKPEPTEKKDEQLSTDKLIS